MSDVFQRVAHAICKTQVGDCYADCPPEYCYRRAAARAAIEAVRSAQLTEAAPSIRAALSELVDALDDGLCNSGTPGFDSGRLERARQAAHAEGSTRLVPDPVQILNRVRANSPRFEA